MRLPNILFVVDEWRARGGAHRYIRDVIVAFSGVSRKIAYGRIDKSTPIPMGVEGTRCRALSSAVHDSRGLDAMKSFLDWADVICIQNVHNPVALSVLSETAKAIVIIQDHRFFCPSIGKTLPNRQQCLKSAAPSSCMECISDSDYLSRTLSLMAERRKAIEKARCVVLSDYMAQEWFALTGHRPLIAPPWCVAADGDEVREGWVIAGRLTRHKDPGFAVDAWNAAGKPETLFILGEGPESHSGPGIEMVGWQNHDSFLKRLTKVRALLFPSLWQEPYGIIGLEALACNTPVIVNASGGMRAWMGRGVRSVSSINEMAQEMTRIMTAESDSHTLSFRSHLFWDTQRARSIGRLSALFSHIAHGSS